MAQAMSGILCESPEMADCPKEEYVFQAVFRAKRREGVPVALEPVDFLWWPVGSAPQDPCADTHLALTAPHLESLPPDRHPVAVLLASRTWRNARRAYAQSLQRIAELVGRWTGRRFSKESLPWWRLRREHIEGIREELTRESGPEVARVRLGHLRALLEVCREMGLGRGEIAWAHKTARQRAG